MKLSIGIFNGLIFLLIIFIFHFVITNYFIDKNIKKESFKEFDSYNGATYQETSTKCKAYEINQVNKNLESEKEDMLKYVLGPNAESDLDMFFKDKSVTNVPDDVCKKRNDANTLPLSTTCDPGMNPNQFKDLKVIENCQLPQDKKHYSLLKIYEDDKPINGNGPVYGDINAYDDEDFNFSSI